LPYIGNIPAEKYAAFNVQYFTTSATDTYTLDRAVANELDIRLVINNVIQEPGSGKAYTAAGTTLTLSAATAGSDTMYAVYIGKAVQTVNPGAGSVGTTALADNAVTEAKLNVSNSPTNGYVLSAQSGATGGLTWAADAAGTITAFTNGVDNRLVTATSATALNGEADLTFDGTNLDLADNKKLRLGTGNDFEIYHDGSNSIIHDGGTGDLLIRAEDDLRLQDTSGYDYIHCNTDSSVELYHNKVKKLETSSTGVTVTGDVTASNIGNFVRTGNVEGTDLGINNFMSSSYYNYVVYASITNTATDNTFINMRFRNSSGGVVTANLNYSFIYTMGDGSTDYDVISQNTVSGNTNRLSVGDDQNETYNYVIHITNHQGNNFFYNFTATTENWTNGCSQSIKGGGKFYSDGTNITGIDFLTNAGTAVSGKIACFAIKSS